MSTWFSSDLHLGHIKAPELCGRPYGSTPDEISRMNEDIIQNHNELVSPLDDVFFLGDMCMGQLSETLPLIARLNGRKTLILGNHDRPSRLYHHRTPEKRQEWYAEYSKYFYHIAESETVLLDVDGTPTLVDLNHLPHADPTYVDHAYVDRYAGQHPIDTGRWLIHGHVHNAWRLKGHQINVGIDVWDMSPVSEASIIDIIKRTTDKWDPSLAKG